MICNVYQLKLATVTNEEKGKKHSELEILFNLK